MSVVYQLLYFISTAATLFIGVVIFFRRPKDAAVRRFGAFIVSVVGWVSTLYLLYSPFAHDWLIFIGRGNFVFALLIAYTALLFIDVFHQEVADTYRRLRRFLRWPMHFSVLAVSLLTLLTDLVDENEIAVGIQRETHYGTLYGLWVGLFVILVLCGLYLTVVKIRQTSGEARRSLVVFAVGWGVSTFFGIITNIVIPFLARNFETQHLGSLSAIFLSCCIGYALARDQMLNVKVLASELLVFFLVLLSVINFALSVSLVNNVFAGVSFVLTVVLGLLIIREIRREASRREELYVLARRLEASNTRLRDLDESKTEFISIASHQLRTPVSVIKGYLSLIREGTYGQVAPTVAEKLEQMREMNERLVKLINGLLDVSRIEKNHVDYDCKPTDVPNLIRRVMDEMAPRAKPDVKMRFAEPSRRPPTAFIDSGRAHEALGNVIDNALKFTEKGEVEISLETKPEMNAVVVYVRDTGRGMTQAESQHAFEKFNHVRDDGRKVNAMGMGIGLYVCARFLRGMGGDVWVDKTAVDGGTTMAISLPLTPIAECDKDVAALKK